MKDIVKKVCVPFFFFAAASAHAGPETDALQRFVDKVDTLSATFQQAQKDEHGKVIAASSGRVWLSRPGPAVAKAAAVGMFRWSYEKPYQQLIVSDGKEIWQYDPDLAQAMVRPAGSTLQGTPAQLLTDRAALEQHFTIEAGGTEGGAQRLRLVPKAADSDFKSIELWLKDGAPSRMRFLDPLGGVSEVEFSDVRTNLKLDAKLFRFDPPKGTEVIRAEAPGGP